MERTLIILKPDALQRGLIGDIVNRFERKGLKLLGIKMMRLDGAMLKAHYSHIADKPFYAGIEKFMQSSPVVLIVCVVQYAYAICQVSLARIFESF